MISDYTPSGDQPTAIDDLERRIRAGEDNIVLLGATGTGKSATTAWLIERLQRPTLVLAPNKTLAAQLANEFRELLPNNAVEYFVSYYDYYQPEAYIAQTDTYIEKDSSINEEVERLRHSATMSLLTRRDVIVVASVSCIYGLGTPEEYVNRMVKLRVGDTVDREQLIRRLVDVQYVRNDLSFTRGTFRVRGDTIEIFPVYEELAVRIEMFGDEIEALTTLHPLTGEVISADEQLYVFPASHYVAGPERMARAIGTGTSVDPFSGAQDRSHALAFKLLSVPALRTRYLGYVREIAEKSYDWTTLGPKIAAYQALIAADVKADNRKLGTTEDFTGGVTKDAGGSQADQGFGFRGGGMDVTGRPDMSLKTFFEQRRKYLLDYTDPKKAVVKK